MDVDWRRPREVDRDALTRFDLAVRRVDGDQRIVDAVARLFAADHAVAAWAADGEVVAAGSVTGTTLRGAVHPAARGRGLGHRLLAWSEAHAPADAAELVIRSESLTPDAEGLYARAGYRPAMVERRMVLDLAAVPVPQPAAAPRGVELEAWSDGTAGLFFAAYRAAFAGRPGFPDPPAGDWIGEHAGPGFQPQLSAVAIAAGQPVAFVTVELEDGVGWIDQIGVAPDARRSRLATALVDHALAGLRDAGAGRAMLHVNENNPPARALFARRGFTTDLRRGRFVRVRAPSPPAAGRPDGR
jgi:ribosomal protein S18 acetylase RimI-like enzyme